MYGLENEQYEHLKVVAAYIVEKCLPEEYTEELGNMWKEAVGLGVCIPMLAGADQYDKEHPKIG